MKNNDNINYDAYKEMSAFEMPGMETDFKKEIHRLIDMLFEQRDFSCLRIIFLLVQEFATGTNKKRIFSIMSILENCFKAANYQVIQLTEIFARELNKSEHTLSLDCIIK